VNVRLTCTLANLARSALVGKWNYRESASEKLQKRFLSLTSLKFSKKSCNLIITTLRSLCRTILVVIGIGGFALSKSSIDQKRYENMRIRERMKKANEGSYQLPERFEGRELESKNSNPQ
jgi:hypothetical protein